MSSKQGAGRFTPVDYDPFAAGPIDDLAPTTEAQREVWLASQLSQEASLAYNESSTFRIHGNLDRQALSQALQSLVHRHDALRATFDPEGAHLVVEAPRPVEVPLTCLDQLDATEQQRQIDACLAHEVETPFDLLKGPLIRFRLLKLASQHHLLLLTAHHIVCDGWSLGVLSRELGALYTARTGGQADALTTAPSYARQSRLTAAGHDQAAIEADAQHWLGQFSQSVPVLDLPTDRPRPVSRQFASRREDIWLDAALLTELKRFSGRQGRSLFSTLLAGFAALIARAAAQDDVVIGVPAAGQLAIDETGLVGHCVNLLPVRFQVLPDTPCADYLAHAHTQLLDAFDHQRCTFGTLLQRLQIPRDPSRLPLVNVMFNVDQSLDSKALGFHTIDVRVDNNPRHFENFELFVNACQVDGQLRLECQYNTSLFDRQTICNWMGSYRTMLEGLVREAANKMQDLGAVPTEQTSQLRQWNHTPRPYPRELCVHDLIAAQCARTPSATALISAEQTLTYAALRERVSRLVKILRDRGVGRGKLVGLCLPRTANMLVAQLAILEAGAAYVPLDPAFPADRLAYMATDAELALLLTESSLRSAIAWPDHQTLLLDELAQELTHGEIQALQPDALLDARPQDPAYVIYTSGSTGKPKGVVVHHQAVVNFLHSMAQTPGLTAEDRIVAVTTLSFDIAVLELLLPLSVGASIVLAKREQVIDGDALKALIDETAANVMQATPTSWRMLIDAGWQGHARFKALVGGEGLPLDLARLLMARTGELWNMYGPTETTVWSTCWLVQSPDDGISIGAPIANTQVHILDEQCRPCPVGVPGEIWIGGDGVTLGYWRRPDLSAERFMTLSIGGEPATQVYRTGDRGRWRHDGRLEHLGRLDAQVKVRGYRIELGEIEAVLAQHADVARVVVIVREDQPGDARLVAYIVARGANVDQPALRHHLRLSLPEYMVPQHFVVLQDIPLLPNGKINRKALPEPAAESIGPVATAAKLAPRNDTERVIAECMAKVLRLDSVDVRANFFELGGHSLLAAQLMSRLGERLGQRLGLAVLFHAPTVEALARQFSSAAPEGGGQHPGTPDAGIPHLSNQRRGPLSPMQMRMWFMEQLNPDTHIHNVPSGHRLRGPFDLALFRQALRQLVERQAALRSVVVEENGKHHLSVLDLPDAEILPFEDLSQVPADDRDQVLNRRFTELGSVPLCANRAPLFRAHLFRLAEQEHIFFFMAHHIVWDGWSFDVLYRDLSELYAAAHERRPHRLPPIDVTYLDYAAWQHERMAGAEGQRQAKYWQQALTPLPAPLALPIDKPRPAVLDDKGATHQLRLSPELTQNLVEVTRQRSTTIFAALMAAVTVLLHRHSQQEEFVIGTPIWGREKAGLEALMGLFINVLPVRINLARTQTFADLMTHARDRMLDGLSCPDVPFEQMVQALNPPRDLSRTLIYQVLMSYQDVRERPLDWGPLKHSRAVQQVNASAQDLGFWCVLTHDTLEIQVRYNVNLFRADSIAALSEDLIHVLSHGLNQDQARVCEFPALPTAHRERLIGWNHTQRPFDRQATLANLLSQQARLTPSRHAVVQPDQGLLTYAELDARSNQVARILRQRGIGRGKLVGLCLERSVDMLVAQHAILKSGAGYVPLDPAYPVDRLAHMVEDAKLALIIAQGSTTQRLSCPDGSILLIEAINALLPALDNHPLSADPQLDAGPLDPAYVIYTSGSTGKPKGVSVPHTSVVNFLASMARAPGLQPDDRLLAVTTLSFDIAVLELMLPLTVGACIVLASREQVIDGHALKALARQERCTVLQATPSTWRMLMDAGWQPSGPFKGLIGGEALARDLADSLLQRGVELWNMYGPTETTVWSTCWRVPRSNRTISIGTPIDNTQVHVLDERMQPCPIGVPGEIWIGGDGVTLGYLHRPDLTGERFVPDPFSDAEGARLYRTGDRGRWCADGLIEHMGRLDFQVKVRGHRIELGEIEAALMTHPLVSRAVVIVREDHPGDQRLVAYLVQQPGPAHMGLEEARTHLRQSLPEYMLPQHVITLDAIPLLPNGKIDRHALPAPSAAPGHQVGAQTADDDALYRHEAERKLAQIWRELLGITRVRREDNFFDLGGHSLLSLSAIGQMEQVTGIRVNPRRYIFESFAQIAAAYAGPGEPPPAPAQPLQAPLSQTEVRPASPAQTVSSMDTAQLAPIAPTSGGQPARQNWLKRLLRKH